MGWKAFSWLYKDLLGLRMMIVNEILKYLGQYPRLMHESAMLTILVRHESFLMISFK